MLMGSLALVLVNLLNVCLPLHAMTLAFLVSFSADLVSNTSNSVASHSGILDAGLYFVLCEASEEIPRLSYNARCSRLEQSYTMYRYGHVCYQRCLHVPMMGGCQWTLARAINQQLMDESHDDLSPQPVSYMPSLVRERERDELACRVSVKLEVGNFRGAIHLPSSGNSIADSNHPRPPSQHSMINT